MIVSKKEVENAVGTAQAMNRDATQLVAGKWLDKMTVIMEFITECILKVQAKFGDEAGKIKTPRGPMKGLRYAAIGFWLLMRVIRLVKDLSK